MKVTITRPAQLMDIGRDYAIQTQDQVLESLPRGSTCEVDIPESAEFVFASLGGYTSMGIPVVNLKDGMHLEVVNNAGGWKLLVPLLPVYYHLVARNKYLKLRVLEQP
jgi:hypothetical protein